MIKGRLCTVSADLPPSIIRIKNPEDGELFDQSQEGLLVAAGVRMSELPLKDCAQGVKRRKRTVVPLSESTRIRCDDCGFLWTV